MHDKFAEKFLRSHDPDAAIVTGCEHSLISRHEEVRLGRNRRAKHKVVLRVGCNAGYGFVGALPARRIANRQQKIFSLIAGQASRDERSSTTPNVSRIGSDTKRVYSPWNAA